VSSEPAPLPTLPGRRAEPRGEVRRTALLIALEELLRERPLADVGIAEIASAAGLKRSAFYFYFPSKEAAVTELLHGIFDEMLAGAQAWLSGQGDPQDSLHSALAGTAARWGEHRHLLLAMLDARDGDGDVRTLWDSWIELFVAPLAGAVEAERAAGHAPPGPAAPLLVRLLLGMNERAFERSARADAGAEETAELVAALASTWAAAIYGGVGWRG
jgi:AcrR family transcriptional regulator